MGYQNDEERGRHAGGYEYGNDAYNRGARQRRDEQSFQDALKRDRIASQPVASPPPAPYGNTGNSSIGTVWPTHRSGSTVNTSTPSAWTVGHAAKIGAIFVAVLAVGLALFNAGTMDFGKVIGYGIVGLIGGAVAAVALYMAVKITIIVLKLAAAAFLVGILSHMLGVINLPNALGTLTQMMK